jgi:hypothetical protein
LAFIPERLFDMDVALNFLVISHMIESNWVLPLLYYMMACLSGLVAIAAYYFPWAVLFFAVPIFITGLFIAVERRCCMNKIAADRAAVQTVIGQFHLNHAMRAAMFCTGLFVVYKSVAIACAMQKAHMRSLYWKEEMRKILMGQSALEPKSDEEIDDRDLQQNVWAVPRVAPRPVTMQMRTTTHEQLLEKVFKNLVHIRIYTPSSEFSTNGFFLKSNVMIIPNHVLLHDDMRMEVIRNSTPGGRFKAILSKAYSAKIEGQDLAIVWVPNSGDWTNLTEYLPLTVPGDCMAKLLYKRSDGDRVTSRLSAKYSLQKTEAHPDFHGLRYNVEFPTFRGLCCSAIVSDTRHPSIVGFHVAGKNGDSLGCCASPTKLEITKALDTLLDIPGVVSGVSTGTMPEEVLGVQYFESPRIHPKSPLNFLPEEATYEAYGSVIGRAKYYSVVVQTPISPLVKKHCGQDNVWGKPKFGVGYPWQRALSKRVAPAIGFSGENLKWAVVDYTNHLIIQIKRFPKLEAEIRPLTREEIVNGKIGKRFIDKMPGNTAIGYPLTGPKNAYYTEVLEPEDKSRTECVDLPEVFWEDAERISRIYREKSERAYPIFKACLKDEPTPVEKDKVRDFMALPVSFQILVRKYFLPIARTLSMLPTHSECAVGINAHGPEWQEMHDHVVKYGESRILAGDYKSYDLTMPAQITQASFSVFIDIAKAVGYSEDDLAVMRGIVTDLTYPVVAYNGDLITLYGGNPSGHNLTVYINCIANSLMLRCAYASIPEYRDQDTGFRDACALMTYGDDCIASVSAEFPKFNHCSVAEHLDHAGMVFTMPDKTSDPIPYLDMSTTDFLKRKSVYHEALGKNLGALDEMSIYKSLHSVLSSQAVTLKEQCVSNIDGAVREWFAHGRDIYEDRRQKMIAVATEYEVDHACKELMLTYDDRVLKWKEDYQMEDVQESSS